jgi:hypothetical protein
VAIPCEKCREPVHEQVVICPHCGQPTGVPTDPIAVATIEILIASDAKPEPLPLPLMVRRSQPPKAERVAADGLPKAILRKRTRRR